MRSMLFVPGDSPRKFEKASEGKADALIIDLEDSVVSEKKPEARGLTLAMLRGRSKPHQLYVRINALDTGMTLTDLAAVMPGLRPLMPPPPPGASPPHPGALSEPGALAAVLKEAGLRMVEEDEVACPFVFPSAEASWRGNSSAGVNQAAIAHSGEAAVRAIYANADRAHTRPDGSIRYGNVFLWAAGEHAGSS